MNDDNLAKHMLYTGHLSSLEDRLPSLVASMKNGDPLAEVWVIVPNQLTRLHLRRVIGKSLGVVANTRFMTMTDLMHTLAEPLIAREGWRTLGEAIVDPLVARIVAESRSRIKYLANVAESPGFRRALIRTRRDLILHDVSPDLLSAVPLYERERADKVKELILLLNALSAEFSALKVHDGASLQTLALRSIREFVPRLCPMALYALYDLPPLTRAVVSEVQARQPLRALLPWLPNHASYGYTNSLRTWFIEAGFTVEHLDHGASKLPALRCVSAPKDAAVATEIVRDVLYDDRICKGSVAVALPVGTGILASALESRCSTSGLTPYVYQAKTLGQTAAGRGFAAFAELLDGNFALKHVVRFLRSAPLSGETNAGEWIRIADESLVREGETDWLARISLKRNQLQRRAEQVSEQAGDDDESLSMLRSKIAHCNSLLEFLTTLFLTIRAARSGTSWQESISILWEYYRSIVVMDEEFADLTHQLEQVALLDQAGIECAPHLLSAFMLAVLETPGVRVGAFGLGTPLIAPREQLIGAAFEHVFLPGFNEGTTPRMDRQDPLLLDSDRSLINAALNTKLPESKDGLLRERFFCEMQIASARSTVTLFVTRADSDGRPLLPSPYVSEILALQHGPIPDSKTLDKLLDTPPHRVVPAHPLEAAHPQRGVSPREYHTLSLGFTAKHDNANLSYLNAIESVARALSVESARFNSETFSDRSGVIQSATLRAEVAHRFSPEQPVSATLLENYWKCPFRFAVKKLLDANAPEARDALLPVDRVERGSLLHRILQRYHGDRIDTPITLDNYAWRDLEATARREIAHFSHSVPLGPRFSRLMIDHDILTALREYHEELISIGGTWRTRYVEESFGEGRGRFPDAVQYRAPEGRLVSFKGRMDRWDSDHSGTQIAIVDYKTGKPPAKGERASQNRLQLAIYKLLAQSAAPHATVQSYYHYFERAKKDEAEQSLAISADLIDDIRSGIFAPYPSENDATVCRNCDVKLACGAQRHSRREISPSTVPGLQTERPGAMESESEGVSDE